MTKEQQEKLRRALYNAKFTTDAEDENPFVGVYFNDLLDVLHDFEAEIYRDGWLAGEANLAKEYKNIQWIKWIPVENELPKRNNTDRFSEMSLVCTLDGLIDTSYYDFEKKEWGWMSNVTHWMPLPKPPRKEDWL